MKNREKYKNELMDVIKMDGRICGFAKKHEVFRMFGKDKESFCGETSCVDCAVALQLWLDEEYEESKVNWNKVPVDTLVRVRDYKADNWKLRYFAGFLEYAPLKYETWNSGRTSKTAHGTDDSMCWRFCELVEDEDDGSN